MRLRMRNEHRDAGRPCGLSARWTGLAAALVVAGVAGCSSSDAGTPVATNPVKGKVILPNGSPLTDGSIAFVAKALPGRDAVGKIQSDGTFTLTTQIADDGAAEGVYRVRIESPPPPPGTKALTTPALPKKYNDELTSGLEVTVKAGQNDLPPFKLDDRPAVRPTAAGQAPPPPPGEVRD